MSIYFLRYSVTFCLHLWGGGMKRDEMSPRDFKFKFTSLKPFLLQSLSRSTVPSRLNPLTRVNNLYGRRPVNPIRKVLRESRGHFSKSVLLCGFGSEAPGGNAARQHGFVEAIMFSERGFGGEAPDYLCLSKKTRERFLSRLPLTRASGYTRQKGSPFGRAVERTRD